MSGPIEEENTFLMILVNIVLNMESSMRPWRPTHPNEMGLLNEKIEYSPTWLMPCWTVLVYPSHGAEKPF
jgi:hypothetical protein